MKLKIKKLNPNAKVPHYAHDSDAGMDLFCAEEITLQSGERAQIATGLAMEIPEGYAGLLWDKSGLSHKKKLDTFGGVIDAGYRGEIKVGMMNFGDEAHTFAVGDKVVQMLIQKIDHPEIVEVEELEDSERGEGGFGSTGV